MLKKLREFFNKDTLQDEVSDDEIMSFVSNLANSEQDKYAPIGREIADDCMSNGLRKGEIVKLSDVSSFIKNEHPSIAFTPIRLAFLETLQRHVQSGELLHVNGENEDIIFVHEKYKDKWLK